MNKPSIGRIFEAVSGILIMSIAGLAAIDILWLPDTNVFGTWGGNVEMALPTAVCFLLTGSVIVLLATRAR